MSERVYRAMLDRPDGSLEELARSMDLDPSAVRAALDRLADLSLLRPSWEVSGEVRPVSPQIGLEALLARQRADLVARQHEIEASQAAAAELIARFATSRAAGRSDDVEQLVGIDRIRDRLAQLTNEVRTEVLAFAPGRGMGPENIESAGPLDESLLRRGVRMRTIYLDSVLHHPPTLGYARWLVDLGADVRTRASLPVRMTLIDGQIAVLPADPQDSGAAAVVLHGLGTVTALCALFEQMWQDAAPLGTARRRDERGLTAQEREVLRLLAAGSTDDVIARRIGVSVRTAGRIVADLMTRLEAGSRFQAGYRLAQAGWLQG